MELYNPKIILETAQGAAIYRIEDQMLANREVLLYDHVDHALVTSLTNQLLYLSRVDPDAPVTMYINSPGGLHSEGMTLYDVMQAIPCPIHTVCTGMAASMAALIFAVGDKRSMLPHGTVMVHEPYVREAGGNAQDLKNCHENIMRLREDYCSIMAKRAGRTLEEIYEAIGKETYFTPEEAIKFGLADEVITSLKG